MIITIDGPSGSGKTSIAKQLAETLGYAYFDTGAMYRAVAYALIENDVDAKDSEQLQKFLDSFDYEIKIVDDKKQYFVAGEEVTEKIRLPKITKEVSWISAIPEIRRHLVDIQRQYTQRETNAVFEGRDIGTVVFPDAELKFFLVARPEIRAQRRYEELITKNPSLKTSVTVEEVLEDINKRDHKDSTREDSPLKQADDAIVVDTSDLTLDEVLQMIVEICKKKR